MKAYIIPGFKEDARSKDYYKIMESLRKRGINPVPVTITWERRTMTDYINEFMKQHKGSGNYILGFSFGAMISLICSRDTRPRTQILCSLSPYFKEDLPFLKKSWKSMIGKKRLNDLKNHSFKKAAKTSNCKTILTVGEEGNITRKVNEAGRKIKNSRVITIKGTGHDISSKEYNSALEKIIKGL
ncbi:MAG: hypothetical protein COV09_00055 [Candidatus Vogelbacteria bacterium CG10_big_fil_rev_8_21_14_0_10_50_13]|uniref:Alpha/beta hydrolase n=1 Tax=Candidatus Vogelbacteria bacterium CG10_big_fil_rev_8_21_14_0_10_50_13 TaxID=1975044 RepID=A0A2H0RIT6_9BACT|nr:MAG: hypothetical protein COV09_00055 [Candidatus Vogelbacteria bacterium CG10_big_fil_rev_8_21_14_0_10_50_13]